MRELRKFFAPEIVIGDGSRNLAGRFAGNLHIDCVMLVTDPGVRGAGCTQDVEKSLDEEGIPYVLFDRVAVNPRADNVMDGAAVYAREHCTGIVAVGGGSPLDCAKGIGIVSANNRHITAFEGVDRITIPGPPLICIPTTAGSSADVSQFAIISDPVRRIKMALIAKSLVPDISLLDPVLLTTLPPRETAESGMDALAHAIEAYVSNASSPLTDLHALEAVRRIVTSLPAAVASPHDIPLRYETMLGSLHAGLAFSNASLGLLHAMAHSLGGLLDLPHGLCNAVLLDEVVSFNYPAAAERYDIIAGLLGADPAAGREGLVEEIRIFRELIGISGTLSDYGVAEDAVPALAANALADPCIATNPVQPHLQDIEDLFIHAL